MGVRKTQVPAIPAIGRTPNEVDAALKATKEALEVGYGRRGDPLDRFVTIRDLTDANLVGTAMSGGVVTVTAPPDTGTGPPGAPIFDPGDPDFGDTDYTAPPAPENVQVHHIAPSGLMVTWDPPDYSNHAYAEVFRLPQNADGSAPTFDIAASGFDPTKPVGPGNVHPNYAGRADGTIFTDSDLARITQTGQSAIDAALNPTTYYYWVRFVSTASVVGPYAPMANQGAAGQLSIDPALVLGQLITNVQNSATYRQLVGQFFNTSAFDPIMQAGGVTNYIATLDDALHGQINQQLIRIIGVSDQPDGEQTVIDRIGYVQGIAEADHANLQEVNVWQAALSSAAANNGGSGIPVGSGTIWSAYRWPDAPDTVMLFTDLSGSESWLAIGYTVTIDTPDNSPIASIRGQRVISALNGQAVTVTVPGNSVPIGNTTLGDCTISGSGGGGSDSFVDYIASIFHNVYVSVDPSTAIGQELNAISAQIGDVSSEVQQLSSAVTRIDGTQSSSWTVRMRQTQAGGLVYAAGFGLGLDTSQNADGTFDTLSTFLINANQFAVMGAGAAGAVINSISSNGSTATVSLSSSQHGIQIGAQNAVFAVTDGNLDGSNQNPLASMSIAGMAVDVMNVSGATVTVKRTDNGSFSSASGLAPYKNALMPAPNIPFVIDTTRNVVGIRGKLVVDGLVRATTGDFDTLTATTAFIKTLQAQVVNANVVIGQRLIAGTPGSGALDSGAYEAISNFIVELNNPVTNQYPLRYWKPSTGQMVFGLDQQANLFVGGNMSVGKNATIATTGQSVLSIGGAGAENDGSQYPLWIGPRANYGNNGAGRTEASALFFVRETANGTARAGFNSDLFLGDSGLMLPTLNGKNGSGATWGSPPGSLNPRAASIVKTVVSDRRLNVKPTRSGGAPYVLIIVSGTLSTQSTGGNDHKGYLLKATLTGSNANIGYDDPDSSGILIQEQVVDDFSPEVWPFTIMGVVRAPPSPNYWVRLNLKTIDEADFSIMKDWNVIAMNVVGE